MENLFLSYKNCQNMVVKQCEFNSKICLIGLVVTPISAVGRSLKSNTGRTKGRKAFIPFLDTAHFILPVQPIQILGARLCCPDELSNEINLIYADGPNTDIVVILNIDNKVDLMADTQQIPFFELTYESDEAKIVPSDDCLELLFDSKRDPEGVAMCYTDPLTGEDIPCCTEGQGKCPLERRSESRWSCKVVVINGQYKEVRGLNKPKEAYFQCFKREGQSTSFWGYWNDKSKDPMYVDDFQCLAYEEAGIEHPPEETSIQFPLKFKSTYDNQSVERP